MDNILGDFTQLSVVSTSVETFVNRTIAYGAIENGSFFEAESLDSNKTFVTSSTYSGTTGNVVYSIDNLNSWETNIYQETTTTSLGNINSNSTFSLVASPTCTTTPTRTNITYQIIQNGVNELPAWISINSVTGKYEGTTPTINENKTYSFITKATWTTDVAGSSQQIVSLNMVSPIICGDGWRDSTEE